MANPITATTTTSIAAIGDAAGARAKAALALKDKARGASRDFEAVFLNSMFEHMLTGTDGDGPFGGGPATGIWRSLLTSEYSKSIAKSGGIGIADHVYRSLIAQQEARGS